VFKNIFGDSNRFPLISVSMELENQISESFKENESKENKNVDNFYEFTCILQQAYMEVVNIISKKIRIGNCVTYVKEN